MSTASTLAYRLGITPWEDAAAAADASFGALLDREEAERSRPLGRALDVGCGRGTHTYELARRGWQAVGLDNVPRAIQAASSKDASNATFAAGDVTDLRVKSLGRYDFFLDVGCLHGLRRAQRLAAGREIPSIRKSLDTGGSAQRMGIKTARDHDPTAAELAALGPGLGTCVVAFDFRPSSATD